ncbi:MAG TPA: hypothetical protein PLS81_04770 [Deltaproteobacteria bacterium]|nr:hypothetical protein [Deltaproteobacteria bacterium]HOM28750.1 hypothetical protein [Deltaproteobacteria bacterium]HPP81465.1 hypothetical protein [Deltaproteobacteria bacterium]
MADHPCCPSCGRRAKKALTSNHFPVYRCRSCGRVFCMECSNGSCPSCGSNSRDKAGNVYAR